MIISFSILIEPDVEKEEASVRVIVVALSVISPFNVVVAPGTVTEVNVIYSPAVRLCEALFTVTVVDPLVDEKVAPVIAVAKGVIS